MNEDDDMNKEINGTARCTALIARPQRQMAKMNILSKHSSTVQITLVIIVMSDEEET